METKKELTYKQKFWLAEVGAYFCAVGVPIIVALVLFPLDFDKPGVPVSLSVVIVALIGLAVFRKRITDTLKSSSMVVAYVATFIVALLSKYIENELLTISIVGMISNFAAIPLFAIANKNKDLHKKMLEKKAEQEIEKQMGA